jgi:hypothetical protein
MTFWFGIALLGGCGITKEFHQTYPLASDGTVVLEQVTGGARIRGWDREELRLSAVARAHRNERLREADIRVETSPKAIRILTDYPGGVPSSTSSPWRPGAPASVEYVLDVPQDVDLERVEVYRSGLRIVGIRGSIRARVEEGTIEASFDRMSSADVAVTLEAVDGNIVVRLPTRADVQIVAQARRGGIVSQIGIPVRATRPNGSQVSELREIVGTGQARLRLTVTRGNISIERAAGF